MTVRAATLDDLGWIIEQTKVFVKFYGSRKMFVDEAYAQKALAGLIRDHVVLVAEAKGVLAGVLAGMLSPHPFNPAIRTLAELFWWVAEPFRGSRAGYLLFKEYVRIGKAKADWVTLCSIINSPLNEAALMRSGFKLVERSYLLEV